MPSAQPVGLLDLPLEIRHSIFTFLAQRDINTKKLLRYWFEKKEVKELIAKQAIDDPSGRAAKAVYHDSHDDFDADEQQDLEDIEGDDEDEDEDGDVEQDEEEEEDEDQDEQDDASMDDDEDADVVNNAVSSLPAAQFPVHNQSATSGQAVVHNGGDSDVDEADNEAEQEDESAMSITQDGHDVNAGGEEPMNEEEENTEATQLDEDGEQVEGLNAEELEQDLAEQQVDEDGDEQMADAPSAPTPVVTAARKWRYIPNFLRITQCPPEVNLFLVSKQLGEEAKDWFYDVAVLRIEATGSFAHTSFFEEALTQIFNAAFSPMENIRRVDVTFVWDTTWIRSVADDFIKAVFPALLRQRAECVQRILTHAPHLKEVTIHWHDSAQDDESVNLKIDILDPFYDLPANIKVIEHYIAADAKPHKRSIAGKRRMEFQHIVDAGLDRLF